MANEDGQTAIDEKFLGRRDLFGLEFAEGLVFLEVDDWEFVQYKPYTGVNSVSSQSDSGDDVLTDGTDEILFLEQGVKKVLHGSIGIYPETMRQYTRYPEGQARLGSWENLGAPSATNGDDYGYINGEDSPYYRPTDENEFFIPPNVGIDFSFYNPDDRARQPKLNLRFREYRVNVLDPRNRMDKNAIKRVVQPGSPMPIAPVGSIRGKDSYRLGDSWGVEPVPRGDVEQMVNGGGN